MPDPLELDPTIRAGWTRDARGMSTRLIDPKRLYLLRRHDRIIAEDLAAIMDDVEPGMRRNLKCTLWFGIPIVVITIGILLVNTMLEGPGAWSDLVATLTDPAMVPIFFGGIVGGVVGPVVAARKKRMNRVRWALLKHRYCPHCAYDLRRLPVDPADGATICPECAGAWRMDVPDQPGMGTCGCTPVHPKVKLLLVLLLSCLALLGVAVMLWMGMK